VAKRNKRASGNACDGQRPGVHKQGYAQVVQTRGSEAAFIDPGRPVQNAFTESFNGKLRDECLNQHWFVSLEEARRIIKSWRMDYNTTRPHSSLGYMTPDAFRLSFEQKLENDKMKQELSLTVV
jgi:putative transposase